jgi:hypothetical protein
VIFIAFLNTLQKESAVASIRQYLLKRKELLTIRVIVTNMETTSEGDNKKSKIYFTGYCDTKYFQGSILLDGCDTRDYYIDELTNVGLNILCRVFYGRQEVQNSYS